MTWVSIKKRKPTTSGYYYWKGKGNYGGLAYFDGDSFDFSKDVPVNKVDEDYLYWLDEKDFKYEE
jgi:hypothetical protein